MLASRTAALKGSLVACEGASAAVEDGGWFSPSESEATASAGPAAKLHPLELPAEVAVCTSDTGTCRSALAEAYDCRSPSKSAPKKSLVIGIWRVASLHNQLLHKSHAKAARNSRTPTFKAGSCRTELRSLPSKIIVRYLGRSSACTGPPRLPIGQGLRYDYKYCPITRIRLPPLARQLRDPG